MGMNDVKVKAIEKELHELYQEIEEGRNMGIARRAVHIASVLLAKVKRQKTMLQTYQQQRQTNAGDTISRQAAIRWVKTECNPYGKPTLDFESGKKVIEHLEQMPSAQPEIIQCKDCKHYQFADNRAFGMPVKMCEWFGFEDVDDKDFCSRAERRTDDSISD